MNRAVTLAIVVCLLARVALAADAPRIADVSPGLTSGCLATATLQHLPDDVLLRHGDEMITRERLDDIVAGAPKEMRPQLKKYGVFLLQELATKELLLCAAGAGAAKRGLDTKDMSGPQLIGAHLQAVVADVTVTDDEVAAFYAQNLDMFKGASFDKIKRALRAYVRKKKRQAAVNEYVRGLGRAYGVAVNKAWWMKQAALALDNPLDRARLNGRPTMVEFGAHGCQACDMMAPIVEALKKKYEGRADIVFVHAREQAVLATRFGIQSIPIQVFFDTSGREVFRHEGFFSKEDIEKKLAEVGVK